MIPEDLGQLNVREREILADAVKQAPDNPCIVEVGTWLGGGSTATFLKAIKERGNGHLWGIEASEATFALMCETIRNEGDLAKSFTPIYGFSQQVLPKLLGDGHRFSVVFLDGGNNPLEQVEEFDLLEQSLEVGATLFSHDAKLRKGKWFVPYIRCFDNWDVTVHDVSTEGLLEARKIKPGPSQDAIRAAAKRIRSLKLNPIELIGSFLPSRLCFAILKMLPLRVVKRLAEGRN